VSSVQAGKFNEGKLVIDVFCETGSHYVTQTDLELTILPQTPMAGSNEGKFYGPFEERLETGKGKQRSQHSASLLCFYLSE
jgi:hypothetical protein